MSTNASSALDALEDCLKNVLLHTGSALGTITQKSGLSLDSTRLHVERALPDFLKRWHTALNELEGELIDAKATLHRDLAATRAKKLSEASDVKEHVSPAQSLDSDTVMVDPPNVEIAVSQSTEAIEATAASTSEGNGTKVPEEVVPPDPWSTVSSNASDTRNVQSSLDEEVTKSLDPTNVPLSTKITNTLLHDKDRSSNILDLDLGPSPQAIKSQTESPLPSIEPAHQVTAIDDPGNDLSNADVGSLLPGLMDYANGIGVNSGNGTNMNNFANDIFANRSATTQSDLPEDVQNSNNALDIFESASGGRGEGGDAFAEAFMQDGDLNFDDSFDFDAFTTGDNMAAGGGADSGGLFGEDFFNLDEADGANK